MSAYASIAVNSISYSQWGAAVLYCNGEGTKAHVICGLSGSAFSGKTYYRQTVFAVFLGFIVISLAAGTEGPLSALNWGYTMSTSKGSQR